MLTKGFESPSDFARGYMAFCRAKAEGKAQGYAEGFAEGRAEGQAKVFHMLCTVLGIECNEERMRHAAGLDDAGRTSLVRYLMFERRWPG